MKRPIKEFLMINEGALHNHEPLLLMELRKYQSLAHDKISNYLLAPRIEKPSRFFEVCDFKEER